MTTPTQLFTLLDACFDAQNEATALWHSQEPEADDIPKDDYRSTKGRSVINE